MTAHAAPPTVRDEPYRPNIVWLVAEDIGPHFAAYGDRTVKTPHIDRLAAEGVTYTNAFAVVGVCAPSRASIITGKYPTRIGAQNMRTNAKGLVGVIPYETTPPPQVKCFTEYLRAAGYYTSNNPKEDYQFNRPITAWDESSSKAHWRNRPAKTTPFFAVFNYMETHESQVWAQADEPLTIDPKTVKLPPYYPDTPAVRTDVSRYYDNLAHLDIRIGEQLAELEQAGLLDETVVIFYGDHGAGLPRGKREVYDSGLQVPLIIRWPNKRGAGTKSDQLVTLMDLGPSMISLAGAKVPEWMDGQAFLGPQKAKPRDVFFATRDRMDEAYDLVRAARDKRWKYIRYFQPQKPMHQDIAFRRNQKGMLDIYAQLKNGKLNETQMLWFRPNKPAEELFDTKTDPHEVRNVAQDPRYRQELLRLRNAVDEFVMAEPDLGFLPEPEMVNMFWPGGKQPVTDKPVMERYHGYLRIASPTDGASVAYQAGGGIGGSHWSLYSEPLKLAAGTKVRAVAIRIGYKQSEATDGQAP
ncbi:MAG: sulfatase [Deltaproteobacteria bacterium]|nr:sulfatase [Deltaproteobacteria bacterium]